MKTDELLLRKRRAKSTLGKEGEWTYEVGDAPVRFNPETSLISASSSNVCMGINIDPTKHVDRNVCLGFLDICC